MIFTFCCACGSDKHLENHHLHPKVDGGSDNPTNLITLCHTCHDVMHGWKRADRRELQKIGIAKARERGAYKGRKINTPPEKLAQIFAMLEAGGSERSIAIAVGVSHQTVYRMAESPEKYRALCAGVTDVALPDFKKKKRRVPKQIAFDF